MSDDILSKLNQAFEHVEAGRLDDAIDILKPVLDATPDNADAWWIYMHAVSDPVEARRALQNVIRIAPDYPGASEMLSVLNMQSPAPTIKPLFSPPPPASIPEAPASIPEPSLSKVEKDTQPAALFNEPAKVVVPPPVRQEPRRSLVPTLAIAAIVVIAIILVVLLLNPTSSPEPVVTSTAVAVDATSTSIPVQAEATDSPEVVGVDTTEEPTALASEEATESVVEPASTDENVVEATEESGGADLDAVLSAFTLAPAGVATEEIASASTLIANVCSTPGREVRTLLPQVMEALALSIDLVPSDAQSVGTRLVNCADGSPLVTVTSSRENAEAFAAGTLTSAAFAASWTPVR